MFLNQWSVALSLLSLLVIILTTIAGKTAIRVLRYWDPGSDSNKQIRLENETWLSSTLMEYGLGFQLASLVLFTLAADNFSSVIAGAMCATGALTANSFGMPTLYIKLAGVFFYGFWIVLHKFDISSENYPLLKIKYIYLVFLLPLLIADITLQTLYISQLEPDIITSCCAVVFGEGSADSNLFGAVNRDMLLVIFYGTAFVLFVIGLWLFISGWRNLFVSILFSLGWALFAVISFIAVTTVFSSYIYAMPYHRCPFCILKPEYNFIGFVIYGSLLPACFFALSSTLSHIIARVQHLAVTAKYYQKIALGLTIFFQLVFLASVSYHWLVYRFLGGES